MHADLSTVLSNLRLGDFLDAFRDLGAEHPSDLCSLTHDDLKDMGLKKLQIKRFFQHNVYLQDDPSRHMRVVLEDGMTMEGLLAQVCDAFGLSPESAKLTMVMRDGRRSFFSIPSFIEPGRDLELSTTPSVRSVSFLAPFS